MNQKVLLIGSSFAAVPLIRRLKSLSYEVDVCGGRPQEPCVDIANHYFNLDYSKPDVLEEALDLHSYCAVIPDCNDVSYLTASILANKYGLPGYDSVEVTKIFFDKSLYRAYLDSIFIRCPKSSLQEDRALDNLSAFNFPLIVKPVDSFSGKGVSKVLDYQEIAQAFERARQESKQGKVIIEEFIEGSLHSHSAFIRNGIIAQDFFVDEFCTVYPFQVNCSNAPSALSQEVLGGVRKAISYLIDKLDLVDGLIHTQFIVNNEEYYLIESMRRSPGDLYPELVARSTGVDYVSLLLEPFLGQFKPINPPSKNEYWLRHTISRDHELILGGIKSDIPSKEQTFFPLKQTGERVLAAPFGRIGIIFAKFESQHELNIETPHIKKYISLHEL